MPLVRQHELMPLVASHLTQYHGSLSPESLEAGCLFLSAAIDTEAYMTSRAAYLPAESIALLKCAPRRAACMLRLCKRTRA
eukprot:4451385-Prymnesium_polylepis.1